MYTVYMYICMMCCDVMSVILCEITLDEMIDFQYYIAVVMSVSLFKAGPL